MVKRRGEITEERSRNVDNQREEMRRTERERKKCVMHNAKVCSQVLMLPGVFHNKTTSSAWDTHTYTHTPHTHTNRSTQTCISDPIQTC